MGGNGDFLGFWWVEAVGVGSGLPDLLPFVTSGTRVAGCSGGRRLGGLEIRCAPQVCRSRRKRRLPGPALKRINDNRERYRSAKALLPPLKREAASVSLAIELLIFRGEWRYCRTTSAGAAPVSLAIELLIFRGEWRYCRTTSAGAASVLLAIQLLLLRGVLATVASSFVRRSA